MILCIILLYTLVNKCLFYSIMNWAYLCAREHKNTFKFYKNKCEILQSLFHHLLTLVVLYFCINPCFQQPLEFSLCITIIPQSKPRKHIIVIVYYSIQNSFMLQCPWEPTTDLMSQHASVRCHGNPKALRLIIADSVSVLPAIKRVPSCRGLKERQDSHP